MRQLCFKTRAARPDGEVKSRRGIPGVVGCLLLTLVLGTWVSAGPMADTFDAARHEHGRAVYNFRCYFCHGYSGDANTLARTYLAPPPRDFTRTPAASLTREDMVDAVTHGRPGTGMQGFSTVIDAGDIEAVVDFVRREFMQLKAPNTRYHTRENGWPDHERFQDAFPFAMGAVPLDTPWTALDPAGRRGKRLFLRTCVSCHDRARVLDEGPVWTPRSVSYPRNGYRPGVDPVERWDGRTGASTFAGHDVKAVVPGLTPAEGRGESLYQSNCAFCHAADGTGRNWIGSFLDPPPRDLTDAAAVAHLDDSRLKRVIRDGLVGTSMPAWRHVLSEAQVDDLVAYLRRVLMPAPGGSEQKARRP